MIKDIDIASLLNTPRLLTVCYRTADEMKTTNESKNIPKLTKSNSTIKYKNFCFIAAAICQQKWQPMPLNAKEYKYLTRENRLYIHIQLQTPYWAFRAALCTLSFKECQRAFASPLISRSIDCLLFSVFSKKQRLLEHCAFVCMCVWVDDLSVQLYIPQTLEEVC